MKTGPFSLKEKFIVMDEYKRKGRISRKGAERLGKKLNRDSRYLQMVSKRKWFEEISQLWDYIQNLQNLSEKE